MPRYSFHMSIGSAYIHDYESTVLADDAASRSRAIKEPSEAPRGEARLRWVSEKVARRSPRVA